jgi:hypothetical protein
MTAFLFFLVLIAAVWQFLVRDEMQNKAVHVKASVIKTEPYKSGYVTTLFYKFSNKTYIGRVRSKYGKEQAGDCCFITVLPKNPSEIIFLEESTVPE